MFFLNIYWYLVYTVCRLRKSEAPRRVVDRFIYGGDLPRVCCCVGGCSLSILRFCGRLASTRLSTKRPRGLLVVCGVLSWMRNNVGNCYTPGTYEHIFTFTLFTACCCCCTSWASLEWENRSGGCRVAPLHFFLRARAQKLEALTDAGTVVRAHATRYE